MAESKKKDKQNPVSPKVKGTAAGGLGAGVVIQMLQQSQSLFGDWAGDWTTAIYMGVVVVAGTAAGYLRDDPKRVKKWVQKWVEQ